MWLYRLQKSSTVSKLVISFCISSHDLERSFSKYQRVHVFCSGCLNKCSVRTEASSDCSVVAFGSSLFPPAVAGAVAIAALSPVGVGSGRPGATVFTLACSLLAATAVLCYK